MFGQPIPLFEVAVRPASRDETGFVLKVDHHRGGDTIALKAQSARDAKDWTALIESARLRSIDARKREVHKMQAVNRTSAAGSMRYEDGRMDY